MPPESLGTVAIVVSLLVAAWCLVSTVRNRPPDVTHLAGLAAIEVLVLAEVVVAVVHLANGDRPHELATFIGYLVAIAIIPPLAGLLARLEPTRWGSVVALIACLVVPVLVLRINQIWTGVG